MPKEAIRSPNFILRLKKLDKNYLDRVEKIILKIIGNPKIGKPMRYGRKGTREVCLKPFRVSYMYDKFLDVLTFLDLYHKKKQ